MVRSNGSTALKLDFAGMTTTTVSASDPRRTGLHLVSPAPGPRGADKYRLLDHRRHQAQMKARRLLDLMG